MKKEKSLRFGVQSLTAILLAGAFMVSCGEQGVLPTLDIDVPEEIVFAADGTGGVPMIQVSTNQPSWSYSLTPSDGSGWLTVRQVGAVLLLDASPNTIARARPTVTIKFSAGDAVPVETTVKQIAPDAVFGVTPAITDINFNANGTVTLPGQTDPTEAPKFTVACNLPDGWNVALEPADGNDWLSISSQGSASFTLKATENTIAEDRADVKVKVTANGATPVEITVRQDTPDAILNVSPPPASITFNADGTTTDNTTFTVTTNVPGGWAVALDPADGGGWLSIIPNFPDGFSLKASANETPTARGPVKVKVTADGADPVEITVNQKRANPHIKSDAGGDYYEISESWHLRWLSIVTNAGEALTVSRFIQTKDIDMGSQPFTPIGIFGNVFKGSYDGNGKIISNLYIDLPLTDAVGLFGCVGSGGSLTGVSIRSGSVKGNNYVGGVCGYNDGGTISACCNESAISGTGNSVGGVCGNNEGGTITACYSTGTVSGAYYVGGVCGDNDGGAITACYSTGVVSGASFVGGVCGYNVSGGAITACYSNGTVSGYNTSGVSYNPGGTVTASYWLRRGNETGTGAGTAALAANSWPGVNPNAWNISDWNTAGWGTSADGSDGKYWKSLGGWIATGTPAGVNSTFPKLWWEK